jgi:hypothetical protein
MHIRRTGCSVAALLTAALWWAGVAGAAQASTSSKFGSSKVTVVDPPAGDRVLTEAGSRIRSELDAAGLSNRSATCAAGELGAEGCGEIAAAAAIALSREDGLATIRVVATLPDGYELRRDVRVPPEAGGDDPAVLAVRAVELLRDIYLDVPRAVVAPQDTPALRGAPEVATVAVAPASSPSPAVRHLGLLLSAAMLAGRDGLGPSVAPLLQVSLTIGRGMSVTAAATGPFQSTEDGAAGSARSTQALATAGMRYELGLYAVRPYLTLAGGLHYLRVTGRPQVGPDAANAPSALSPLVVGGGGVSVRLYRWMAVDGGVAAAFTFPATNVTVNGEVVGKAGAPSMIGQLGISVMFASF